MECTTLLSEIDALLNAASFKDYCPNGLQIQGRPSITKIAAAVTASRSVIEQAVAWGADALLVHHGYFWKGEDAPIVGMKHGRIAALIKHDINLIAYHLPLDAHPTLGNNAQLALRLGFQVAGQVPTEPLVWHGASDCLTLGELAERVEQRLGRAPQVIGDASAAVGTVAWCTGAAQGYITTAAACGAQTFISGEVSERTFHEARELGVNYLACGHHATERFGVQRLGKAISEQFNIEYSYFELNNPI